MWEGIMQAAATTGPASGPLPASSTPATCWKPFSHNSACENSRSFAFRIPKARATADQLPPTLHLCMLPNWLSHRCLANIFSSTRANGLLQEISVLLAPMVCSFHKTKRKKCVIWFQSACYFLRLVLEVWINFWFESGRHFPQYHLVRTSTMQAAYLWNFKED